MVDCPNCHAPMQSRDAEVNVAVTRTVAIASCDACNLFWFPGGTILGLTPQAVLNLFQFIGTAGTADVALQGDYACPGCRHTLQFTHDLARTMRFTYWRCPDDHGQLITFGQFLAEKNMIRPPSPAELEKLRATVRQVNCSQCGAPIDLMHDNACPHCGAAVALIDPEGVAKAVRELQTGATAMTTQSQANAQTAISNAQLDALFDLERMRVHESSTDLIAVGAAAIGALIGGLIASR